MHAETRHEPSRYTNTRKNVMATSQRNGYEGPAARPEVEKMHAYQAPLEGRRQLLRLDFNENTIGPSPRVVEAIKNIPADHISIYPEYNGLREAFIRNLNSKKESINLHPEQIGVFNGVDAAIHSAFQAYGSQDNYLLTTTPTFGYYTPCANMQGMKIMSLPYEGNSFTYPIEKIKANLVSKKPKLLLICNPNNPTGTRLNAERILDLATLAPNTLVVVDELYEAFTGDSILPLLDFDSTPNVVVLRSLSKTAGLAGLRIGFAIGNDFVINRLNRVTGPYDVNSFAVTAALAALADQGYIDEYVSNVLHAKDWISSQLINSGKRHHIDGGNYFLLWPKHDPCKIEQSLRNEGILIRNMSDKPCINGSIRVSIGTKVQMEQFWNVYTRIDIHEL